ncbi:unnamed protein product [Closterium sp. NIES-64]|nr:unnamed protein product [Closterium sp. NIES-64]
MVLRKLAQDMREWIHRRVSHGIRGDCYGMVPVSNGGGREEGRRGIRKDRGIEGAGTGHARVAGLRVGERGREGGEGIRGIWKEGLRGDGGKKMARVQEREVYEAGCRGSLLCSLSPHSSPNPPPLPLHASFQRLFPTPLAHTTPPHLLPTPSLLPLSPTPFPHAFPSPLSPTSFPHAFSSPPSPPPTPFPHAFCSPHSPTHPLPPRNFLTPLPVQEDADLRVKPLRFSIPIAIRTSPASPHLYTEAVPGRCKAKIPTLITVAFIETLGTSGTWLCLVPAFTILALAIESSSLLNDVDF